MPIELVFARQERPVGLSTLEQVRALRDEAQQAASTAATDAVEAAGPVIAEAVQEAAGQAATDAAAAVAPAAANAIRAEVAADAEAAATLAAQQAAEQVAPLAADAIRAEVAADADQAQTAAGTATSEANRAALAASTAAINANVYTDTTTGRAAVADGVQFQVVVGDEIVRYRRDSATTQTEVGRFPSAAKVSAVASSLSVISQVVGYVGDIPDGTSTAGRATYTLTTPIEASGSKLRFSYYSRAAGAQYIQIISRSGDVNTVVRERLVQLAVGFHTIEIDGFPYGAGQYFGFRLSGGGFLAIATATPGYGYWSSANLITEGSTYTDATVSNNVAFHLRFEPIVQNVTGEAIQSLQKVADEVGQPVEPVYIIGRPDGSTLVAGVSSGTPHYVFETTAPRDVVLDTFSIYALSAGTMEISAWDGPVSAAAKVARIPLAVVPGLNTFQDVGLILQEGQRLALRKGSAEISFTSTGVDPTPYRSLPGESGALGSLNSTNRFEFTAKFLRWTLIRRVNRLEDGGQDSNVPLPDAYHMHLALGESHVAGRSTILSPTTLPAGAGYVYRRATENLLHLQDPTGNDATAVSGTGRGSFYPAFGRQLWEMSGGRVGAIIVNSGLGSTTVENWSATGGAWLQAVADWQKAIAAVNADGRIISGASISIAIGSNDAFAGTSKAAFKAGLLDMITRARALVGGGSDVPVVLVQTGPFLDGTSAAGVWAVQEAQAEIVRETAGVSMGYSARYSVARGQMIDNVHHNQDLNDAGGRSLAIPASQGAGCYPAGLE